MENLKAISGHVCSRDCGQSTFAKEHQYRSSFTAFSVYLMPSHVTRSPTFVFAYCKIRANNKRKKSVSTTVQQQSRSKAMADLKGKRMASYTLVVPVEVTGNPEQKKSISTTVQQRSISKAMADLKRQKNGKLRSGSASGSDWKSRGERRNTVT